MKKKANLDIETIDFIIKLCEKEEEWCFDNHRRMEYGAWGKLKEKLNELKESDKNGI